jgi:hypothetical protein
VYIGVGLLTLWKAVNNLKSLIGDPPVSGPTLADWSFREIIKESQFPADPATNKFSLYGLASFIKHTPPIDTEQNTFETSFRELLNH